MEKINIRKFKDKLLLLWATYFRVSYVKYIYFRDMKRKVNLKNPKLFSEKITWLNLFYWPFCEKVILATDKFELKKILIEKGYKKYLPKTIAVYENIDDIEVLSNFPNEFVFKKTNSSGDVLIVKNKSLLDLEKTKKIIREWFNTDFGKKFAEFHYSEIMSRVICEEYIENINQEIRFFCFNGEPLGIQIDNVVFSDESIDGIEEKKDTENRRYFNIKDLEKEYSLENIIRIQSFKEILEISREIASEYLFVRIDFFEAEGVFYISELTFTPSGGRNVTLPLEKQLEWGSWIKLP